MGSEKAAHVRNGDLNNSDYKGIYGKDKKYEPSEKLKCFLGETVALELSLRDTYRLAQENQLRIEELDKYGLSYIKSHRAEVEKARKNKLAIIMKEYDRECEMSARKIYGGDYDLIKEYCPLPKRRGNDTQ